MTVIRSVFSSAMLALVLSSGVAAQEYWKPPIPEGPITSARRAFEYITPDGSHDSADVGTFRVPVRYDAPSRDSLTLVYVRLRSRAARAMPPIVYLSGGPGSSAIDLSGFQQMRFFENLRAAGDVILLDQRGTGRSEPRSTCAGRWNMPPDLAVNDPRLIERLVAQGRECATALRARGVDLGSLTTANIADDVDALRRTLGVERVSLFGFSSGSHFALETARRHPGAVARIIIGGVEGAGQSYKLPANAMPMLTRLDSVVRANPPFGGGVPALLALMDTVHGRLNVKPAAVKIPIRTVLQANRRPWWQRAGIAMLAWVRPTYDVTIHTADLQAMMAIGLGRMDVLVELPALYRAMADGRYDRAGLLMLALRKAQDIGPALAWTVDCIDGVSRARADSIANQAARTPLGEMINFPFPQVCGAFGPLPSAREEDRAPVRSSAPVLMAVGTLDGRTSLEQAREVTRWLPNAQLIVVDNAAHGDVTIFNAPEIRDASLRFLRGESVGLTHLTLPAPVFVATRRPAASLADTLYVIGTTQGATEMMHRYATLRAQHLHGATYDFGEPVLNDVGYRFLKAGATDAALAALRRNLELYPRSLNAYDSMGEALIAAHRWADAAACLETAVSLGYNPHSYRLLWTIPAGTEWKERASESVCTWRGSGSQK